MIKTFDKFIKESENLFIPRNLEGREDKFFRNLQRKLDSCNGIWEENLDLRGMEIPSWFKIPNNLKIEGILKLMQTNISELPKNLQCEGLWLHNCKNLKELPEGLYVNLLYITNSGLTKEYCEQMKQEGKISYELLIDMF